MKLVYLTTAFFVILTLVFGFLYYKSNANVKSLTSDLSSVRSELTSKKEILEKQYNIDTCLEDSYTSYKEGWVEYCKLNKIKVKDDNCSIPLIVSNEFDKAYRDEKAMCINRYK